MKTFRKKALAATILLCTTLCVQSGLAQNESRPIPTAAPMQQDAKTHMSSAGQRDVNLPNIDSIGNADDEKFFEDDFKKIFEDAIKEDPSVSRLSLIVDFRIHRVSKGNQSNYIPSYEGMNMVSPIENPDEEPEFDSESDTVSNGVGFWWLIVAFVLGCAAGLFLRVNKNSGQSLHDSSKKRPVSNAVSHKYEQTTEKSPSPVSTQRASDMTGPSRGNMRDVGQNLNRSIPLMTQEDNHASSQRWEEMVIANEQSTKVEQLQEKPVKATEHISYEAPKPNKIVKYGQISVPGDNELLLEEDYIVDDPTNMPFEFVFDARMDEGTYDINENLRSMFAEDPDYIKLYVNPFRDVPGATRIVTVRPGRFRKSGADWKVIEKLTIELK